MNGQELLIGMGCIHSKYVQEAEGKLPRQQRSPLRINKKTLLIAVMITLAALLMGAAIKALVSMRVKEVVIHVPVVETEINEADNVTETQIIAVHAGEEVNFDEVSDVFLELGSYYPQEIPEGYAMTFVSEGAPYQNQRINYENKAGKLISFTIYIADEASSVEIYDIKDKMKVHINGHVGILYEHGDNRRTLVWTDEKMGFGFGLRTHDETVDLIAMAESTAEGKKLIPSRSEKTTEAIAELGDYSPTYLPEGFEEQGVMGSPIADGGGWYSYVRKWYINRSENIKIYFEYESYRIITGDGYTDDAKTACSFFIPGYDILRGIVVGDEVEVSGMFGIAAETDVAWADPKTHTVFHLYSKDITGNELIKVAQSISKD